MLLLEFVQPADAAADDDAAAVGILFREIESAVLNGGVRGHHGKLSETVQPMYLLFVYQRFGVEVLYLAAEVDLEFRGVELFDGSDTALACQQRGPEARNLATQRVDRPH